MRIRSTSPLGIGHFKRHIHVRNVRYADSFDQPIRIDTKRHHDGMDVLRCSRFQPLHRGLGHFKRHQHE